MKMDFKKQGKELGRSSIIEKSASPTVQKSISTLNISNNTMSWLTLFSDYQLLARNDNFNFGPMMGLKHKLCQNFMYVFIFKINE